MVTSVLSSLMLDLEILGVLAVFFLVPLIFVAVLVGVANKQARQRQQLLLDQQCSLETIRALTWRQFEVIVGEAFRRQGYDIEQRGGARPDGGVDLVLRRHGMKTLVQCKRWRTRQVGVAVIRELYGVMASEGAAGGIIVTCGYFTPDALAFAQSKSLELIGGNELLELIRRGQVQAAVTAKVMPSDAPRPTSVMPGQVVKPVSVASAPPFCPMCRKPMLLRKARQGPNAGNEFWGCSDYPRCRGTRQI